MAAGGDGRVLSCCLWGPADGHPLFVLHGSPGSRFLRHPDEVYQRAGARVITYDRPGYGGSTRLPGRRVSHAAADVLAIADQLGLTGFSVCGISCGGPHALAVAALAPERVRRCATVVGLGPAGAEGLDFFAGMAEDERRVWEWVRQGEQAVVDHVLPEFMSLVEGLESGEAAEGLSEWTRHMLAQTFREAFTKGPGGYIDDCLSLLQPWGFEVADVRAPTRIMMASDDEAVPPAHGQWLARHVPGAELIVVPGGHLGPHDEEEERVIAWLSHDDGGRASV